MLRAIIDCGNATYDKYALSPDEWGSVRDSCGLLLHREGLEAYEKYFTKYDYDGYLQGDWQNLLSRFDGKEDEDLDSSDQEGMMDYRDKVEAHTEEARDMRIAYDQLKAFSERLKKGGSPAEVEGYQRFLVSVFFLFEISQRMSHAFTLNVGAIQPRRCCW